MSATLVSERTPRRRNAAADVQRTEVQPQLLSLRGVSIAGFHRLAVWHWPAPGNAVPVVCVHGLTRNGRDFDHLARAFVRQGRSVFCPDLVGRGRSDWLRDPLQYHLGQYAADLNNVLTHIGAETIDWVGTSLGGLAGMTLAAMPGSPIRRMVLNDVGPFIPATALRRLGAYLDTPDRRFKSLQGAEAHYRRTLAPFGVLIDAEWSHLTEQSVRPAANGGVELRYEPSIARTYRQWQFFNVDLWSTWASITCPTLVLRGADSDFLTPKTAERMASSGPRARVIEIAGCGHVPSLTRPVQVAPVIKFLAVVGSVVQ